MKIAIATEGNKPSTEVSSQGARALFFLVFNEDGHVSEILENTYAKNDRRVGPDVANMLINMHVSKVVAGRFGPKFKEVLEQNDVECIEQTGFAAEVAKEHIE